MSVMVLDAENRSSLAVIRSIGRAGIAVFAASHNSDAIGLASKYTYKKLTYSNPNKEPKKFAEEVYVLVNKYKPSMLIPCSDLSLELILEHESNFKSFTCLPFSNFETIKKVLDKGEVLKLAKNTGINIPNSKTVFPGDKIESFPCPAIVKAKKSFNDTAMGFDKPSVFYANEIEDINYHLKYIHCPSLLQEKITGEGIGLFILAKNGEILNSFAHKRVLEKPPTGGVSVLSESIDIKNTPYTECQELVQKLGLDGMAMIEFKRHSDGKLYLMEINPRFWGSLQLAISSGVDFPAQLYFLFTGKMKPEQENYKIGHRLRWLFGTLDHLYISIKENKLKYIKQVLTNNQLKLFKKPTSFDVFDFKDIMPFIKEVKNYFLS